MVKSQITAQFIALVAHLYAMGAKELARELGAQELFEQRLLHVACHVLSPQRVAKRLPKPRASVWPWGSVNGTWRASTLGCMGLAGNCYRNSLKPVKDESAGYG